MNESILISVISLAGTLLGSLLGVITSSRLTNYRIAKLEEKVNKHNNLVERMVAVEASGRSAHKRLDGLEGRVNHMEEKE